MTSMGSRPAIGPITFVEFGTAVDAEVCLGMRLPQLEQLWVARCPQPLPDRTQLLRKESTANNSRRGSETPLPEYPAAGADEVLSPQDRRSMRLPIFGNRGGTVLACR